MSDIILGTEFLKELEMEAPASHKCLERVPANLFSWKPHDRSMEMGYLATIVAEVPRWIQHIVDFGEVDFATFTHEKQTTPAGLVAYFENNMKLAEKSLSGVSNKSLKEMFYLKHKDKILMSSTKKEAIESSINHMVHHRGQLTVYMRLNDIPVPSIYGPSADDKTY